MSSVNCEKAKQKQKTQNLHTVYDTFPKYPLKMFTFNIQ